MSTAKHTPGPWITRYYDRVTRHDDIDGSKSIAHVYGVKGSPDEQPANRNLIAAAPDMLAALKAIVAQCPATNPGPAQEPGYGWRSEGNTDDIATDVLNECLWKIAEIARPAIAIAENGRMIADNRGKK
jgi:hypothetical protein